MHYDGNSWSSMNSGSATVNLSEVWGSSSTDVFAVGTGGTILHYDGNTWSNMPSGTSDTLSAVWGSSSSDVYTVGTNGIILHYSGQ